MGRQFDETMLNELRNEIMSDEPNALGSKTDRDGGEGPGQFLQDSLDSGCI